MIAPTYWFAIEMCTTSVVDVHVLMTLSLSMRAFVGYLPVWNLLEATNNTAWRWSRTTNKTKRIVLNEWGWAKRKTCSLWQRLPSMILTVMAKRWLTDEVNMLWMQRIHCDAPSSMPIDFKDSLQLPTTTPTSSQESIGHVSLSTKDNPAKKSEWLDEWHEKKSGRWLSQTFLSIVHGDFPFRHPDSTSDFRRLAERVFR
jgi:hypothetical protein